MTGRFPYCMMEGGYLFKMRFSKFIVNLVLGIMEAFKLVALGLASFFRLVFKPLRSIIKFFYHLVILPAYHAYWLLTKKSGGRRGGRRRGGFIFLANKRLIHILIILFTAFLIYNNLTASRLDQSAEQVVGKTLLARLVANEFASANTLIEDMAPADLANLNRHGYQDDRIVLRPVAKLNTRTPDISDDLEGESPDSSDNRNQLVVPERSEPVEYLVAQGDTLSTIARRFGVSVNTVLWENGLSANSYIRPGDKLNILPATGVMHKIARGETVGSIARKYGITADEVLTANHLSNANQIKIGGKILIPGGQPLSYGQVAKASPTKNSSKQAAATVPALPGKKSAGVKMVWPTNGTRITQYYSWRHNGLDIANKKGTPIYAADSGVVETASWNSGGYGNQIVVNHGNGIKTRYAHMSAFSVHAGQQVDKGDYLGAMGSTGRSTGSHLHFEVMISGARYNPLNYVAY